MIITIIAVAILNCDQRLWVPLLGMISPFTCVLSSELDMQIDIGSLGYKLLKTFLFDRAWVESASK